MPVQFDPVNKYILITSPTKELTALEIYGDAMDWCDELENMQYAPPIEAVGKFDMGGGVYSDSIFMLANGWKIKFWSGTYQATITGTLLPEPGQQRTVPPDSGNIEVVFQVSSQATVIEGEGVWTETEKNGLLSAVNIIQAKTDNLPEDPGSQSSVQAVKVKTDQLPTDPARESSVERVEETLILHDSDVRGNPPDPDANLRNIKQLLEERVTVKAEPKSIAQYLEQKARNTEPVPPAAPKGMFETVKSGNIKANGTEQTLLEYTEVARIMGYIDLQHMEAGDSVVIRQYLKVKPGSSYGKYAGETYSGVQSVPIIYLTPKETDQGMKITIEQTAGPLKSFAFNFIREK